MKKVLCTLLALAMVISLAACGKKNDEKKDDTPTQAQSVETTAETEAAPTEAATQADATEAEIEPMVPGTLYQLNEEEGKDPVILGVGLDGNCAGESGGINGRETSDENIRSVFELNEWISIRLDTDKTSGIKAYVIPHQDDPATLTDSFIAALDDKTPFVELNAPEGDVDSWGDLYVNPEDWQPGSYDLVLADGMKPVARVLIELYPENDLSSKSDAELQKLMADAIAAVTTAE